MAAAVPEAEKKEKITQADSDLQYVLQEAGLSIESQYAVVQRQAVPGRRRQ